MVILIFVMISFNVLLILLTFFIMCIFLFTTMVLVFFVFLKCYASVRVNQCNLYVLVFSSKLWLTWSKWSWCSVLWLAPLMTCVDWHRGCWKHGCSAPIYFLVIFMSDVYFAILHYALLWTMCVLLTFTFYFEFCILYLDLLLVSFIHGLSFYLSLLGLPFYFSVYFYLIYFPLWTLFRVLRILACFLSPSNISSRILKP